MGRGTKMLAVVALLSTACAESAPVVTADGDPGTNLAALFAYGDGAPAMSVSDVRPGDGHEILDITYTGHGGSQVEAFLIIPSAPGRHGAIVFMHQGAGNRSQFFDEATALAGDGFVSLLVGIPWSPDADRFAEAVIALRSGADLLNQRDDVDPARLGYVGHSWGATFGTILAAVDQRFQAYVLMAGVDSLADLLADESLRPFDSGPYLDAAPAVPMLFQHGEGDSLVPSDTARRLYELAGEPKEFRSYPTDHNFRDATARQDRLEWLEKHLGR